MIGSSEVGKKSLCSQFLSSEHVDIYNDSVPDHLENGGCHVQVQTNDTKTQLTFIVLPAVSWLGLVHGDSIVRQQVDSHSPAGFLVLFAVDDKSSLNKAQQAGGETRVSVDVRQKSVQISVLDPKLN